MGFLRFWGFEVLADCQAGQGHVDGFMSSSDFGKQEMREYYNFQGTAKIFGEVVRNVGGGFLVIFDFNKGADKGKTAVFRYNIHIYFFHYCAKKKKQKKTNMPYILYVKWLEY